MKVIDILNAQNGVTVGSKERGILKAAVVRESFAEVVTLLANGHNLPLSLVYATDERTTDNTFKVHALIALDAEHEWVLLSTAVPADDPRYPSLTATVMAAHWYERYLHDMFGIVPEGHPDLRRLVSHENVPNGTYPLRKDFAWNRKMDHANEPYPMGHVEGEGIYEIPVGPIHAGIIEPGHFRFNVAGERILTLEGKLFFTHKGVEKLLEGKTPAEALPFIERLSGDMAAANALAFSQAIESIGQCEVPKRALFLRMLVTEMERLTMHIHDLANIGGMGTGYSFIAANGFRVKERLMRLSDEVLGNRFWRGYILPGGVAKDLDESEVMKLLKAAEDAWVEMRSVVVTAFGSDGFLDRLQTTGRLPLEAAKAFGAVGLPARASGVDRDVRRDHPYAAYGEYPVTVVTKKTGDVYARYTARVRECDAILSLLNKICHHLPSGPVKSEVHASEGMAIGAVESWRGEILTAVHLKDGRIERCFPRDPSFCNWALFAIIGPGNIVPDFPVCNKSLNLSYSGTDM
jgi:Ni,Fe-hydrogenase III large subunit/Ni,Fe-hydrogenase III component G